MVEVMYRLTPRMLQRFERDLRKYHELFSGGRCSGWQQEELLVSAINSDTAAQHHALWREAGHDDQADLVVRVNENEYPLQIKSGQVVMDRETQREVLVLSGHRLGRFEGDLSSITAYLNARDANIIAVPYRKIDDESGRKHVYQVSYVDIRILSGITAEGWEETGTRYEQANGDGVNFSIRQTMSWQVWWRIPIEHVQREDSLIIG